MRNKNKDIKMNRFFKSTTAVFGLMFIAMLAVGSCTDSDLVDDGQRDGNGPSVRFNVIDGQQIALEQMQNGITQGNETSSAFKKFIPHQHKVIGSAEFANTCLLETTVEGVNPVMYGASTRGVIKSAIDGDFSVLAYTGMTEQSISKTPNYLYNARSDKSGKLYTPKSWPQNDKYGIFYGIFPYTDNKATDKIRLSNKNYNDRPYVDFTVKDEITQQVGLFTACSGIIQDNLPNEGPTANLKFRPALTAVRFAVGQNLSWDKVIDRLEIKGASSKGRYTLPNNADGTGGKWSQQGVEKNFVLSGINVSTKENPNTVIIGKDNDNYTFLMVPQKLTGRVAVHIHFTDGTDVRIPLTGEWVAGVTKTYKLSNTQSNWEYFLTASSPATIDYKTTMTGDYSIMSYRQAPDGTQQPVAWEVVGYDGNNDGNYTMSSDDMGWITSLSKTTGKGGMFEEKGQATVNNAGTIIDLLKRRNDNLRNAPRKGSPGKEYDLSTHLADGTNIQMTTANCYVISSPGSYKLPLIFGNAMVQGQTNESSYNYTSAKPDDEYVMYRFQNHMGNAINSPYICGVKHARSKQFEFVPTGAKLIWADGESLVKNPRIIGVGKMRYLAFDVAKEDIKHGNAVVAALGKLISPKGGVQPDLVLWSWHLWFTESDVLKPIEVSDYNYMKHGFTAEDLGWKYTQWSGTSYKERSIKVKVIQKVGNQSKQTAIITVSQRGGTITSDGYSTHYQWGRKEAFPGTEVLSSISMPIKKGKNGVYQSAALQYPATFYVGTNVNPDWSYCHYKNLWSATNEDHNYSTAPIIKTIYDPSPVGFHVPSSSAFTGFTKTGREAVAPSNIHVDGNWNNGWNFIGISQFFPAYFPAAGHRGSDDNRLYKNKVAGYYWTAIPSSLYRAFSLYFDQGKVNPVHSDFNRANAFSIRPEADN